MLEQLLKAYLDVLKIHIGTKTVDKVFHEFTGDVYEKLFDVFHGISEKMEDLDQGEYTIDCETAKQDTYNVIEGVMLQLDGMKDKYSTGMDDLVRGLINDLENLCGTARGFVKEEKEEVEEVVEKKDMKIKIPGFNK